MTDYEVISPKYTSDADSELDIVEAPKKVKSKSSKRKKTKLTEKDDLVGMIINVGRKINPTEIIILWIVYLFIHSSAFIDILKKINGTTNDDNSMTLKGTFYSSLFMVLVIVLCSIIF